MLRREIRRRDRLCGLVVSSSNAAELLETIEHALDPVAVFVVVEVAVDGLLAIGSGRNDRQDAFHRQVGRYFVPVISLVGQHRLRLLPLTWREREGVCGRNPVPGGGLT